ncbi:MAG: DNA polymerase III subunit alpha [Bacteroidales bacterium]|nr:DNA polymerase III subunit alpha [Bacteroidales bacterium]
MYLNCHSYYSLRYGTLPLDQLVQTALDQGINCMTLTDINNSMGVVDFVKECGKKGIRPLAGIEFRDGNKLLYIGIARNNQGFKELNDFLSYHNIQGIPLPDRPPAFNHCYVIYPFGKLRVAELRQNEFTGIRIPELNLLLSSEYRHKQEKLLALCPLTFSDEKGYELHRNLRAIDNNILLSMLTPAMVAPPDEMFLSPSRIRECFESYPQILLNTSRLMEDCSIEFDFTTVKNKKLFSASAYDDKLLLEKLAMDGLYYRYGKKDKEALRRVKHELEIIDRLGFSAYFLITWDIIRYTMSRTFYHVGRGSGANSIVAYCLRITDVDPIELNLYFERFLNPKRSSPPDFDIDYSWKDRDEVFDYIFKRYGREHTALLGATSTFKGKSILRELGKVYGLPKEEIDILVEEPNNPLNNNDIANHIMNVGVRMTDFPNIRSIHAGGVLVSEEPLTCYTALDMPPKAFPTTQWDMYVAEDLGFEKLDILSQRGLGHIKECADIIRENRGINVDVHRVQDFKKDEKVKSQLRISETIGCFYIESPAMRGLLSKLKCDNYLTLVAASSIIRPGVARSGMMKEYIWRFHNPDKFSYIHPIMAEQLGETYGVMVYQEDVLKICHHFAGMDLADADVLRRAMSGKFRSRVEFQKIVDKFFDNCRARKYPEDIIKEVWRQIESFAGYSFSKAHSASFAVESYQSLYLKAHYPIEFMVAVINNFGGFYKTWVYVNEARRCGAKIELPCVNHSMHTTSLSGITIWLGFIHIANLESQVAHAIIEERQKNGEYQSLEDFTNRIPVGLEQAIILIRLNAFRFTGKTKQQLLWEVHNLLRKSTPPPSTGALFTTPARRFELPVLVRSDREDAFDEMELIDFPVTMSYFELLQTQYRGEIDAHGLRSYIGRQVKMVGMLVTIKYVRTIRDEVMNFGTFFDVKGEFFDTVHFPPVMKQYPFKGRGVYLILGKVVEEFGFPIIEVEKMAKLPLVKDDRYL